MSNMKTMKTIPQSRTLYYVFEELVSWPKDAIPIAALLVRTKYWAYLYWHGNVARWRGGGILTTHPSCLISSLLKLSNLSVVIGVLHRHGIVRPAQGAKHVVVVRVKRGLSRHIGINQFWVFNLYQFAP